jgi:hypothetical protein
MPIVTGTVDFVDPEFIALVKAAYEAEKAIISLLHCDCSATPELYVARDDGYYCSHCNKFVLARALYSDEPPEYTEAPCPSPT